MNDGSEIKSEILSASTCTVHDYKWVVVKPAEIGVKGEEANTCSICKHVKETREIPAIEVEYAIGDVNADGKTTAADARLALRASVNLETFDEAKTLAADADHNGKVTAADARLILRASVGLETLK